MYTIIIKVGKKQTKQNKTESIVVRQLNDKRFSLWSIYNCVHSLYSQKEFTHFHISTQSPLKWGENA